MMQNSSNKSNPRIILQGGIFYLINENTKKASVYGIEPSMIEITIPRSIILKPKKYIITSILSRAFKNTDQIKTVKFAEDSEVEIIEKNAFYGSSIEKLYIPPKLINLSVGWCQNTKRLNEILINPLNQRYIFD